jgi:predicted metalloprotease
MRIDDLEQSSNVEDRRGMGGVVKGGGLGIGAIIGLTLLGNVLGIDPRILIGGAEMVSRGTGSSQQQGRTGPAQDEMQVFVNRVLRSTEIVWSELYPRQAGTLNQRAQGQPYQPPRLVSFTQRTGTQCGVGEAAMGPFYCPPDATVYIDNAFFNEMRQRLGGGGQFAYAYVVAHEVGHHIQHKLGILNQVQQAKQRLNRLEQNRLQVRVELMADCLAGVWAHHFQTLGGVQRITQQDVDQALRTAAAIGDDSLQRGAGRPVQQESFTHGSAEQRMQWFSQGFQRGTMASCNTFQTART